MPFFMVYESKAILPTDLEYGAPRGRAYDDQGNQASLEDAVDQLEEACDVALLHFTKYQQALPGTTITVCGAGHSTSGTWCVASDRTAGAATS
jgi:hypothetical protein